MGFCYATWRALSENLPSHLENLTTIGVGKLRGGLCPKLQLPEGQNDNRQIPCDNQDIHRLTWVETRKLCSTLLIGDGLRLRHALVIVIDKSNDVDQRPFSCRTTKRHLGITMFSKIGICSESK